MQFVDSLRHTLDIVWPRCAQRHFEKGNQVGLKQVFLNVAEVICPPVNVLSFGRWDLDYSDKVIVDPLSVAILNQAKACLELEHEILKRRTRLAQGSNSKQCRVWMRSSKL